MEACVQSLPWGVVLLAHFCEVHGPSLVLCTEMIDSKLSMWELEDGVRHHDAAHGKEGTFREQHDGATENGKLPEVKEERAYLKAAKDVAGSSLKHLPSCLACSSLPDGSGLITRLADKDHAYISTRSPGTHIYAMARNACMRSLSCELSPQANGVVLFSVAADLSSNKSPYPSSATALLSPSRPSSSTIPSPALSPTPILSPTAPALPPSPALSPSSALSPSVPLSLSSHNSPTPLRRSSSGLAMSPSPTSPVTSPSSPSSSSSSLARKEETFWTLSFSFKLKDSKSRGMHKRFSFLLLFSNAQVLLGAIPFAQSYFASLTSDMQARAEEVYLRDVQEEGTPASRLYSSASTYGKKPEYISNLTLGAFRRGAAGSIRPLTDLMQDKNFFFHLHAHFAQILYGVYTLRSYTPLQGLFPPPAPRPEEAPVSDYVDDSPHRETTLEPPSSSAPALPTNPLPPLPPASFSSRIFSYALASSSTLLPLPALPNVTAFLNLVGTDVLRNVMWTILIGKQLVVRAHPDNKHVAAFILDFLKKLVPKRCCSVNPWSESYLPVWECHLLGLPLLCPIPQEIDPSSYAQLSVSSHKNSKLPLPHKFEFSGGKAELSTILQEYETNTHQPRSDDVLFAKIKLSKKIWKNVTQVLYTLSLTLDSEEEARFEKFKQAFRIKRADLMILKFWLKGMRAKLQREMQARETRE